MASYRMKTQEELEADGFRRVSGGWYAPHGCQWGDSVATKMLQREFSEEEITTLLVHGQARLLLDNGDQWNFNQRMLMPCGPVEPLCNCSWNKHPLYCECK